ncbi:hypothetical protein FV217_15885 [Methylobacterium sp. WL9]|nr:hypothetical protein FV217_15885 [Methylobacterium sp. WL9]
MPLFIWPLGCQRCHVLHDRTEHQRRRLATLFRWRALGDLFRGPYPNAWDDRTLVSCHADEAVHPPGDAAVLCGVPGRPVRHPEARRHTRGWQRTRHVERWRYERQIRLWKRRKRFGRVQQLTCRHSDPAIPKTRRPFANGVNTRPARSRPGAVKARPSR